ncbi:MAG TPA: recombinase family protein [Rubrobacteraceae bacterium]
MPSTNGHGPKRAILYARVSTDEQARSGYSLAQQMEALRGYATREGYEILQEIEDRGQSGASLERPGIDRVRDLVAAGGISVVLAQDRDRFAREPAYHYLLRREFEEHGCQIGALNDRGDDSPEGELTDGILDQLAKFERAKTAERSRRGKLRKAREGKVVANNSIDYGFKYNDTRDGYEVDEATMPTVRRIFRMVGLEGSSLRKVKQRFEIEGLPTPGGKKFWSETFIREVIKDDVYRPHSFEEVQALVTPEVAAQLDPDKSYGIWWFNRQRHTFKQVVENTTEGKVYRKQKKSVDKPRNEWIAVPVPDASVSRELVDDARATIKDNRAPSNAGRRFWQLSGGLMRCGACGRIMNAHTTANSGRPMYFYYTCRTRYKNGTGACENGKYHAAVTVEARTWEAVAKLLKDPEQLRADLDAMIELERNSSRGDPDRASKLWTDKLLEVDRKRTRYQEMAADDLITFDELRSKLSELDSVRATAEEELEALRNYEERVVRLEKNRDTLLASLMGMVPEALDKLTPEERCQVYKMLKLRVSAYPDGSLEVSGAFGEDLGVCEMKTAQASPSGCVEGWLAL